MVQYAATLADDPILRWGVEALADDSPMGTVRYAAVLPLGLLQGAILDLCEHWQFVAFVHRHPDLRGSKSAVPARIDWPSLESDAASDAANCSSNNPFGLDGNYWLTNAARLQHTNDGRSGPKPLLVISLMVKGLRREPRNLEWQDFTLLLDIVRALGGKPLVVSAPFPGPFYDYWGMTAAERARYYAQMRAITSREHVPLVDFSEHDGDRNFIRDAQEHLPTGAGSSTTKCSTLSFMAPQSQGRGPRRGFPHRPPCPTEHDGWDRTPRPPGPRDRRGVAITVVARAWIGALRVLRRGADRPAAELRHQPA
jgi:hypothetical protein